MQFYNHGKPFKISLNGQIVDINTGINTVAGHDDIIMPMVDDSDDLSYDSEPEKKKKSVNKIDSTPKDSVLKAPVKKIVKKKVVKKTVVQKLKEKRSKKGRK